MRIISFTIFLLLLRAPFSHAETLTCTRVVDGNIIILNNGEEVSLIGVDTPETKHPRKPVEYFAEGSLCFHREDGRR